MPPSCIARVEQPCEVSGCGTWKCHRRQARSQGQGPRFPEAWHSCLPESTCPLSPLLRPPPPQLSCEPDASFGCQCMPQRPGSCGRSGQGRAGQVPSPHQAREPGRPCPLEGFAHHLLHLSPGFLRAPFLPAGRHWHCSQSDLGCVAPTPSRGQWTACCPTRFIHPE